MYTPPAFRISDRTEAFDHMRACGLASLITATAEGLMATPLPLLLDEADGGMGVLHGHVARANPQWSTPVVGEAMVMFPGPDAYITPSWYETKRQTGKVVPTWNYIAVHAYGVAEFYDDAARLLDVVTRLTDHHEGQRAAPWKVSDAPDDFIASQLKGIIGLRLVITRIEAKRKMSQNRPQADRLGVQEGLENQSDQRTAPVAALINTGS